ncbi:cellulose biosynthesis cyclic di-GMP-binding regulatory protein BcsB [Mongoliitalea daihaiensis]|uniref:cellulose biosynthesis cyclic di-GMP-binding regulatory protein BcsB n=1 Tax=Mongoliitalea daihaiensis TaxID=2782006 RepID=UPI001F3E8725|nr:cellulose biosynthesis cyclic di-GMP-binding regulatory protein BcsB [Mongoliitalea daihaiensis]UJP65492.1 cellulose biosynthesis cyclic di-GMP-binding regulatory protein BcsB [Mongoliitalea daihaiensis]
MKVIPSIFLLLVFLTIIPHIGVSEAIKRPLSEFGYPRQTIVYGQKNGAIFFIKEDPLRDYSKSGIHLELMVSPLIDKSKSTILLKLADSPVMSLALENYGDTIHVFVPFKQNAAQFGFIKLSIEPNLWYPILDCMDIDQKTVWMKVTENSFLEDHTLPPPTTQTKWTLGSFMPSVQKLLVSKKSFQENLSAISKIHYYYQTTYGKNLQLQYLEDSSPLDYYHAVIVGSLAAIQDEIPEVLQTVKPLQSSGLSIHTFEYLDSIRKEQVFLNSLIFSGNNPEELESLIYSLFNDAGESFLLSDSFQLIEENIMKEPYQFLTKSSYTLGELGLDEQVISGKGRIRKNLTLPEFISKPSLNKLGMNISVVHKPIEKGEQAYLNIFLNNKLIQTYKLNETGRLERKINPIKAQFGTGNYLGFEFIYIPSEGMCDPESPDFYAHILPYDTDIQLNYHRKIAETLHAFPANFHNKSVHLVYDMEASLSDIPKISKIIGLLNVRDVNLLGHYLPSIIPLDKATLQTSNNSNYIFLSNSPNNWNEISGTYPHVLFSDQQLVYRSEQLDRFFEFYQGSALDYVQLYNNGGSKFLQFNLQNNQDDSFDRLLDGFRDQFLTNTGNVMTANTDQYFFFDLNQTELKKQQAENRVRFESYWNTYRILIISLLIGLSIILLMYIYKKSRIAQKSIEDARK